MTISQLLNRHMKHKIPASFIEYGKIDIGLFLPLIEKYQFSESWNDPFRIKNNGSHKSTENLVFIWTPILDQNSFSSYVNADVQGTDLIQAYQQTTEHVLSLIPGKLLRATLIRMQPQSVIKYHLDGVHELWKSCHRIHLPIITEPEVKFYYKWLEQGAIQESSKHLAAGTLVEIDNFIPHGVAHKGHAVRYHLMYDILPDSYAGSFTVNYHSSKEQLAIDRQRELTESQQFFRPIGIPIDPTVF